jgi:hypothetical protein
MRSLLITLFLVFVLALGCNHPSEKWVFKQMEGSKAVFTNGKTFDSHLVHSKFWGQLKAKGKAPYLVFTGRECSDCDAEISVFIHSPSDGAMPEPPPEYPHPGKLFYYENNELIREGRAFIGQCLPEGKEGVIWFEKNIDGRKSTSRILIVQVNPSGSLKVTESPDNREWFENTATQTSIGLCREIPGINQTSSP